MGTGVKVAIGGVAALAVAATWFWVDAAPPSTPSPGASQLAAPTAIVADAKDVHSTTVATPVERQQLAPQPTAPNATLATIRGRCIADETQTPLSGCRVAAGYTSDPEAAPRQTTGSDGTFAFGFAPTGSGDLRITWRADGRLYRYTDLQGATAGRVFDLGDVSLRRGARLSGVVVDSQGAPVEAQVILQGLPIAIPARTWSELWAISSRDGSFAFDAVPAGTWPLAISAKAKVLVQPQVVTVPSGLEEVTLRIVLAAAPSISGSVVDEAGRPIADAELWLEDDGRNSHPGARSRRDGTFELFALWLDAPMGHVVVKQAKGFEPPPPTGPVPWGTRDLRLVMQRALPLTVHVTERGSGAPVERFAVLAVKPGSISVPDDGDYPPAAAPDGRRTLADFRRGPRRLAVFPDDRALLPSAWVDVDAEHGAGPIELQVDRLQPLTAHVQNGDGTPRSDVQVEIVQLGDGNFGSWSMDPWTYRCNYIEQGPPGLDRPLTLSKATTGADGGAALFTRYTPTAHGIDIRVTGPHIEPLTLHDPPLTQGQPLDIIVQSSASLTGSMQVSGYAPDTVFVVAERYENPAIIAGGEVARLGSDGSFAFDGLRSGNYRIWFSAAPPGGSAGKQEPTLAQLTLRPGEQQRLDLDAHRFDAAHLGGRILVDGAPLPAPHVQMQFHTRWRTFGPIQGNLDGSFQVDSLPPGPYVVGFLVDEPGSRLFVPQDEPFEAAAGAIIERDFHFTRRTLSVRVLDAEGRAVADREVVLQQKDEDPRKQGTDAAGLATFAWAPSGALTVTAAGLPVETITFAAGETERTVDLRAK